MTAFRISPDSNTIKKSIKKHFLNPRHWSLPDLLFLVTHMLDPLFYSTVNTMEGCSAKTCTRRLSTRTLLCLGTINSKGNTVLDPCSGLFPGSAPYYLYLWTCYLTSQCFICKTNHNTYLQSVLCEE